MIEMTEEAYKKFLKFVLRFANPFIPSSTWQETIGFLFGKFSDNGSKSKVFITDVLPMDSGSSVYVKVGDYSSVYDVLLKKAEDNEFIVGWIHSHPGLSIFLSGTDVSTQKLYQQMDPRAVAIVIDHTTINDKFPGLKAFRVDDKSYHQVDLSIKTSVSYSKIYNELRRELSVILPPEIWKEEITVSLENLVLNFEGPQYWSESDQIISLELRYSIKEPGLQHLELQPNVKGASFYRRNKKIYRYQLYDKGLVVRFGIMPDRSHKGEIELKLDRINLFGKDGDKKSVDDITFIVKSL
ncbi:MAG: hypothetical protein ACW981_09125 [Candidatus Hodarchaeales archaeon]|jgi:proteasome lid subunit RPN8/RPN11